MTDFFAVIREAAQWSWTSFGIGIAVGWWLCIGWLLYLSRHRQDGPMVTL